MTMINAYAKGAAALDPREQALVERRERLLGPAYRLFYETPVHLVRGEGVWLYDPDGEAYLDVYNNVACVGHCHPACRGRPGAAGRGAEHAHALPERRRAGLCRAAARDFPWRAGPHHVHLHRQRGE